MKQEWPCRSEWDHDDLSDVTQAPMMVSAVACIIGNIAYCLSYDARSLALLVVARLITGFGKRLSV